MQITDYIQIKNKLMIYQWNYSFPIIFDLSNIDFNVQIYIRLPILALPVFNVL